jgi:hypothetical protein
MKRLVPLTLLSLVLAARLALAEPGVRVTYQPGVAIVRLEGDYSNSRCTVLRADAPDGAFEPVSDGGVLCLGECLAADDGVQSGRTYWYRFDLVLADGRFASFGPYAVPISSEIDRRVTLAVNPNPARGPATIRIALAGRPGDAPVPVRAVLFDLQGRRVRVLHDGALARGSATLAWDGRAANGRPLEAGAYLLRAESALGVATTRLIVAR